MLSKKDATLMSTGQGSRQTVDTAAHPENDFDPLVPDHVQQPWPALARARRDRPIFYMPKLDLWCVTRYDHIREMLKDTATFRNSGSETPVNLLPREITDPPSYLHPELIGMAVVDPPYHTRLRKLMWPPFAPRQISAGEEAIRTIADSLIDRFISHGKVDLVSSFANPFPVQVIAQLLGFPLEAAERFRRWTDGFVELFGVPGLPHARVLEHWHGLLDCDQCIRDLVRDRRANGAGDMVSAFVGALSEEGEPALTDDEIVANVFGLIAAGTDTTAILITNLVHLLLEHRTRWEEMVDHPDLAESAIEEALRYRGPVRGVIRVASVDCRLGGIDIPKGSKLYFMPASGNLDDDRFPEADQFDLHRATPADHLAFGVGRHFCLGAPLARLEARVALRSLVERIPTLQLVSQNLEYHPNLITPMPVELILAWDG
jgi:cytochrome P450